MTCLVTGTSDRHYGLPRDIQALVTGTMAGLVTGTDAQPQLEPVSLNSQWHTHLHSRLPFTLQTEMWAFLLCKDHISHLIFLILLATFKPSLVAQMVVSVYNAGDLGSIPGLGRSPGEGNANPLQSSCLEKPMDRGAWWATVHGIAKSWTRLSNFTFGHFKDKLHAIKL